MERKLPIRGYGGGVHQWFGIVEIRKVVYGIELLFCDMHNMYIMGKFREILPYYCYKSIFSMKYIISDMKWGTPMVWYCGNIKRSLWH